MSLLMLGYNAVTELYYTNQLCP